MGWQRQPHGPTIQQALEDALERILSGERPTVRATGRTDAGVHAAHQVASFQAQAKRSERTMTDGLNGVLPRDIACLAARHAPAHFDPRGWTRRKMYRYRILMRRERCPFRHRQVWNLKGELDVESMARAAKVLEGYHDFSAFRATRCTARHPRRLMQSLTCRVVDDELHIEAVGHGFLRHQVRIVAGTLVDVGQGRIAVGALTDILASRDRAQAGPTAPSWGLWLQRVDVGDGPRVAVDDDDDGDEACDGPIESGHPAAVKNETGAKP